MKARKIERPPLMLEPPYGLDLTPRRISTPKEAAAMMRDALAAACTPQRVKAIADLIMSKALKGDVWAIETLFDRFLLPRLKAPPEDVDDAQQQMQEEHVRQAVKMFELAGLRNALPPAARRFLSDVDGAEDEKTPPVPPSVGASGAVGQSPKPAYDDGSEP